MSTAPHDINAGPWWTRPRCSLSHDQKVWTARVECDAYLDGRRYSAAGTGKGATRDEAVRKAQQVSWAAVREQAKRTR